MKNYVTKNIVFVLRNYCYYKNKNNNKNYNYYYYKLYLNYTCFFKRESLQQTAYLLTALIIVFFLLLM